MGHDRGSVIARAVDAVIWVAHRQGPFTVRDLADGIGISDRATAAKYLDAISMHLPVVEVEPYRRGGEMRRGSVAAVYRCGGFP